MGSALRFTGLASGMDTESVVKALMTNYQAKIDKQAANKTKSEWKQEIYTDLNAKLKTFRASLSNLRNTSNICAAKSNVSQQGILSVNNVNYKGDENYSVLVKQVATKANVKTMVMDKYKDDKGTTQKVTSQSLLDDVFGITGAISSGKPMTEEEIIASGRNAVIKIGNATVDLGECTNIQDIVDTIAEGNKREGQSKSDVQINFNDSIGAFTISSMETGANQIISITAAIPNAEGDLSITENTPELEALVTLGIGCSVAEVHTDGSRQISFTGGAQGTNAVVEYNNSLTFESESNEIEIDGLAFTIENVSDTAVTISVTQDTDKMYEGIKSFVNSYNSLLDEITTKYYADSAAKYSVLTEEQKEAMSDKEVEIWENKIKDSLLRRDDTLKSLHDIFREAVSKDYSIAENGGIDKDFSMLSQIGIGASDWTAQGKLTIDEDKLRTVIASSADKVADLVSKIASSLENQLMKLSNKSDTFKSYGSFFNDKLVKQQILDHTSNIGREQDRYDRMESYYYAKFSAMETAMNNANSYSSLFSNL